MFSDSFVTIPLRSGKAARVHVFSIGSGPTVLFLHGWIASGGQWKTVIEELPSGYSYIAPDLPGFGESEPLKGKDVSLDTYAELSVGLISAISERGNIHAVVGDSLGAVITLKLLLAGHLKDCRIFLTGCPANGLPGLFNLSRIPGLVTIYLAVLQRLPHFITKPLIKAGSLVTLRYVKYLDKQILDDIYTTDPHSAEITSRGLCNSIIAEMANVAKPQRCLIVRGEGDIFVTHKTAARLTEILGGNLFEIQGVRHNPKIENRSEFVRVLKEFLE